MHGFSSIILLLLYSRLALGKDVIGIKFLYLGYAHEIFIHLVLNRFSAKNAAFWDFFTLTVQRDALVVCTSALQKIVFSVVKSRLALGSSGSFVVVPMSEWPHSK